ncbi:golgin subfamily A member 6-like protein 7 [Anabrus simplex]|uniref:golgin subfamily A member 6-like protein 7 n=1 Tax=Anabrus simplex TaxID=316456 RepID=UPI0035A2EC21
MEHDIKESGSDSDISDGWTVLNCKTEQDQTSQETGHIEASDEDSVESFGAEKLEIPKRDEESDGISVISESDVCDHIEVIPVSPEVNKDCEEEIVKDAEVRPVQHPTWRRRCCDSFSESDGCELADLPGNFSLCPRKLRRQRPNRPLSLSELDTYDYVEDFPVLTSGSRMQSRNEACMQIYVHRPNDQINYLLTILLALALAAVAGLGTGHFLGTKEVAVSPEETVYKLKLENQLLQSQLQELLREREVWRRISANLHLRKFGDMDSKCSESRNNIYCFPDIPVLNHSVIYEEVPVSVSSYFAENSSPILRTDFQNINGISSNDKLLLQEQLTNNFNVKPERNNILKKVDDNIPSKNIATSIPSMENISSKHKYEGIATAKLAEDVKLALAHGLELSGKLKEALTVIDVAFANWKSLETEGVPFKMQNNNKIGKKALKELKHILYDGKTKKLISKTAGKLNSIKKKLFKNYDSLNLREESVIKESNADLKPEMRLTSALHSEVHKFVNVPSYPLYQNNSAVKSDAPLPSGLVYGPHLPTSDYKSPVRLPNLPESNANINEDTDSFLNMNSFENKESFSKDTGVFNAVKDEKSVIESQYIPMLYDDLNPLEDTQKYISSEEIRPQPKKSEEIRGKPHEEQSRRNEIHMSNKKQQSKEKSNKPFKKQKYAIKEQNTIKFQESHRSSSDKIHEHDKKKKQKDKKHKSSTKGLKGEKVQKSDNQGVRSETELKHKYRSKFQESRGFKHVNKFFHKRNNDDSGKNFEKRLYEKSHHNMNNLKKNKEFEKAYKYKKRNSFRYGQAAWSMDDNGYRFTNTSGDWLIKRYEARARQRDDDQKSDWLFERAMARKMKREEDREKGRWYFQRARSRETCRVEPIADWCKTREKRDSHKFDKSEFWRSRQFNENYDYDDRDHPRHYQRDWRAKHPSRYWKGSKFISQAFKAAVNLMKA